MPQIPLLSACLKSSTLPMAKKGFRSLLSRACQLLQIISGPIPAGSPQDKAKGFITPPCPLIILDNGVAAKVTQIGLRAFVDPLVLQLRHDLVKGRIGCA